ncbi:MAG: RagB/SusD family nutrient uptake outer membrane protein [Marinilabiliaceae bacterium]
MKNGKMKYISVAFLAAAGVSFTACDDFLERPTEDNYVADNFYQNDAQLYQAVNPIYNSPWYDFQRGFFKVGEVMAGNYYWGSSPYLTLTVNATDEDLVNMSASLWSVNAYCNTQIKNIKEKAGAACTEKAINATIGECLTLKALAYFFLVRSFGGVPIVHDNSSIISSNSYNDLYRAKPENVYDYIVNTLKAAMEYLPKSADAGRIDYYCAEGLLAKVYLTKAGVSGSLNKEDLENAIKYAKDVKENSGRELEAEYANIFRISYNTCPESLIAWRWTAEGNNWTRQNTLQSDLSPSGFDETGATWGGWAGPSVDLQKAFGEDALANPEARVNTDARRKATLMMAGDVYEYFWRDRASTFAKGGFEILDFYFNTDEATLKARDGLTGGGEFQSGTGAQEVKHLVGDQADHEAECGYKSQRMAYSNATHILRLADVYLVLAEASCLLNGGISGSTTDADAIDAFYQVRHRSVSAASVPTSITWEQVWKERRLELACEGDRWYDFVRLAYFEKAAAENEIKAQDRGTYYGLSDAYKTYFSSGYSTWDVSACGYTAGNAITSVNFTLPFPDTDLLMNPHLTEDPIDVDVNQYTY